MRVRMRSLGIAVLALLLAGTVGAEMKRCGDDVDGSPVACDCGDVLVSSRRLGPDDPIVGRVCPGRGLLVDVPADAPAATLALGGTVLSGSGRGAGIQVKAGGRGGLTIVGPGTIHGFRTGVVATGRSLARVGRVRAAENVDDGFRIAGSGYSVLDCDAHANGGDGFVLRGADFEADGNQAADNGGLGFRIAGRNGALGTAGLNVAATNVRGALAVRGRDHAVPDAAPRPDGGATRVRPCRGARCR
jgi:hypothetical protein